MKTNKIIKSIGMSTVGIFSVGAIAIPTTVLSSCSDADKPKEETKITIGTEGDVKNITQNLEKNTSLDITTDVAPVGTVSLKATFKADGIVVPSEGTINFLDYTNGTGILTVENGGDLTDSQTVIITASCDGVEASTEVIINPLLNEEKLEYAQMAEGYSVYAAEGVIISGDLVIPDTYKEQPVFYIPITGFLGQSRMTSIAIPNNVTIIEKGAFAGCSQLGHIDVTGHPNFAMVCGADDYTGCLVEGTTIADDCSNIIVAVQTVRLYENVDSIANDTFKNSSSLTSVYLSPLVDSIGERAFSGCTLLKNIAPLTNVITIGQEAFSSCVALQNISLSNALEIIPDSAFSNCDSLTTVVIPDGVTTIGEAAFNNCKSLTNIKIGKNVTSIHKNNYAKLINPFNECYNLNHIDVTGNSNFTMVGGVDQYTGCLVQGEEIADDCSNVRATTHYVSLPNSVSSTAFMSLAYFSLVSITTPVTFTEFDGYSFTNCFNLINITMSSITPPILGVNIFDSINSNYKIYVNSVLLDVYKNTKVEGWTKEIKDHLVSGVAG